MSLIIQDSREKYGTTGSPKIASSPQPRVCVNHCDISIHMFIDYQHNYYHYHYYHYQKTTATALNNYVSVNCCKIAKKFHFFFIFIANKQVGLSLLFFKRTDDGPRIGTRKNSTQLLKLREKKNTQKKKWRISFIIFVATALWNDDFKNESIVLL